MKIDILVGVAYRGGVEEVINETAKYLKFSNELFPEAIDAFGDFMSGLLPEVDYET